MSTKRLFLGMEVQAPWPEKLPSGRCLDPIHRHLTLAFLGDTDYQKLEKALSDFPHPHFTLGFTALFDQCLFLPPKHPRVVAWHLDLFERDSVLINFQSKIQGWLLDQGFHPDTRHSFNPHVTLARPPFQTKEWEKQFVPLPAILNSFHLYESHGSSRYTSLWSYPLLPPFEEFEHTADIAYRIRGESIDQLLHHATWALAFNFPPLIHYLDQRSDVKTIEDVIITLNEMIALADQERGCPFKAVSFHSKIEKSEHTLTWEMIVDV